MNSPVCRLSFGEKGSDLETWLAKFHRDKFIYKDIKKTYISRHLFGEYVQWRYKLENIEFEYKKYFVSKIIPNNERYTLYFNKQKKDFDLVIVAVGSQETPNFINNSHNPNYIKNIYSNLDFLEKSLSNPKANIAILGTSSAFLDIMRLLQFTNLDNYPNLISISGSGQVPSSGEVRENCDYSLKYLNNNLEVKQVILNLKKELNFAFDKKVSILDIRALVNAWIKEYLFTLESNDQVWFLQNAAILFESLMKRGAPEVVSFTENLISTNKLKIIADKITSIQEVTDSSFEIYCKTNKIKCDLILNCLGSTKIDKSNSELIKSLINDCNCKASHSQTGLLVDDSFMLAKNLFAFGPIITGSINKYGVFHHLENVKRIYDLSFQFGEEFVGYINNFY